MKKNKKLIVLVSVLLLTGGISLAYYIGSALINGTGAGTSGVTANINGAVVKTEGVLEFNDVDIYPGHQNVSSIKVTATGDNELIPYNLIWTGINTLNTPLNYTIYKTSSEIEVTATCEKKTEILGGAQILKEECEISNIESLGTPIANGTIETSTANTKIILAKDEFVTASPTGEVIYYYVVLEYPNLNESQNSDMGGSFSGTVNVEASDAEADINVLAVYVEEKDSAGNFTGVYKEQADIPTRESGYGFDIEKSVCNNGAELNWDYKRWRLYLENLTQVNTQCYLYFTSYPLTVDELIASKTVSTRDDFSTVLESDTTGTIYTAEDDDGTTYYFAGDVSDNWVKFAGFYWRIMRINGDGSIRLVYQGTTPDYTNTGIGESSFNTNTNINYMSGTSSSNIKIFVDTWYKEHLLEYYDEFIDYNPGFCNDRTVYPTTYTETYYGGYGRLYDSKKPSFICPNSNDLFTTTVSNKGNKALTYPIGLITADEFAYAGAVWNKSNNYFYLRNSDLTFSMTPSRSGRMIELGETGMQDSNFTTSKFLVRPVINLKPDTLFIGYGISTSPYLVAGVN